MTPCQGLDGAMVMPLVTNSDQVLTRLRSFVRTRGWVGCDNAWREWVHSFADEHAFVDFSARRVSGRVRVLIEFGVHDESTRRLVGFFDAFWNTATEDFEELVAICLEGAPVELDGFGAQVLPYLVLPSRGFERSEGPQ